MAGKKVDLSGELCGDFMVRILDNQLAQKHNDKEKKLVELGIITNKQNNTCWVVLGVDRTFSVRAQITICAVSGCGFSVVEFDLNIQQLQTILPSTDNNSQKDLI